MVFSPEYLFKTALILYFNNSAVDLSDSLIFEIDESIIFKLNGILVFSSFDINSNFDIITNYTRNILPN